jgi:hypothetical protein
MRGYSGHKSRFSGREATNAEDRSPPMEFVPNDGPPVAMKEQENRFQ